MNYDFIIKFLRCFQFLMTGQPFRGQQQVSFANQQHLASNQQPQIFIPKQPATYLSSSQQPVLQPKSQQPMQQSVINLDSRQQVVQYNPQQPTSSPYSQQSIDYTELPPGWFF